MTTYCPRCMTSHAPNCPAAEELDRLRGEFIRATEPLDFLQGTAPAEFLGKPLAEYAAHLIKTLRAENQRLREALEEASILVFSRKHRWFALEKKITAALEGK